MLRRAAWWTVTAVIIVLAMAGTGWGKGARAATVSWNGRPSSAVQGVWLSPDWVLQGTHPYNESEVRNIARTTIADLKKKGVNTVFFESFLRATSIAPCGDDTQMPVFPHLRWNYASRGARTLDPLQIFIDEANSEGIAVHAWVHCFYWRMDNDNVYSPWQYTASMWDDLLRDYLSQQADALSKRYDPNVKPLIKACRQAAASITPQTGVNSPELTRILAANGYDSQGRPLSRFIHELMKVGRPAPDFLLIGSADDPFPHHPGRTLRAIFVNPAHPVVQQRVLAAIKGLSQSHPDLAGVHLDHIRYPMDAEGIPTDLEPRGREYVYFDNTNPILAKRYQRYQTLLEKRDDLLTDFVHRVHDSLGRGQALSAAVLPLYYVERSNGRTCFCGYDYAAQDWYRWDIDFVVPMMYGFDPWKIRTLVRRYKLGAADSHPGIAGPYVLPGVSKLRMAQSGLLGNDDWVYFDLSLGLDMKLFKESQEDYTWTPRRDF
jgi:uncharacterized lipoprotein YddW (UPF0748 family)